MGRRERNGATESIFLDNRGILAVLVVAVIVLMISMFNLVQQSTYRILAPVEAVNADIRTQVAQVLHPTPTIIPDPVTIIHDVQALARLETIQYSVEKVITAEIGQENFSFLFGDRILFVAHGIVVAGIDLSKLTEDDLWMEGENLFIRLPAAEVFVTTLDNDQSYVYDRVQGILTAGDQDLETRARQAAEDEILKAAMEDGILDQAQINAESFLENLIDALGFDDVVFVETGAAE